ncbi:11299_t:CDS:2, partial [Rhizophagus irregularis]
SDAGSMYLELMKQQQENPIFHVNVCFEVLLDTTAKTNRYSMILCVVILIDNHNRSRLVATAFVSDETKETFSWLFSSISKATNGLIPKLLYTDADPAMVTAASSTWTTTKHHFCLFHIRKNLEKHFLGKYGGEKWKEFFTAFCRTRNSHVEFIFEEKWAALLQ